jgi:hypothetical protein
MLYPGFYFCLACATPYKSVESVLPRPKPVEPTEGMLIARRAPHVWPLFWTYLGVVVGTFLLCTFLAAGDRPDLAMFLQDAALFVATCVFA